MDNPEPAICPPESVDATATDEIVKCDAVRDAAVTSSENDVAPTSGACEIETENGPDLETNQTSGEPTLIENSNGSAPCETLSVEQRKSPSVTSEEHSKVAETKSEERATLDEMTNISDADLKLLETSSTIKEPEESVDTTNLSVEMGSAGDYDEAPFGGALKIVETEEHPAKEPDEAIIEDFPSPETVRANDADESAAKTETNETSDLVLDLSEEDGDSEAVMKRKSQPDEPGKQETDDKEAEGDDRQNQDEEQENIPAKSTTNKPGASLRHRSQRMSVSSNSSCPCCVESSKASPSHKPHNPEPPAIVEPPPQLQTSPVLNASSPRTKNQTRPTYPVDESDDLAKPFHVGWKRELVYRATCDPTKNRKAADIYYFTPSGSKLRSMNEVLKYVNEHPKEGLAGKNFTFTKDIIYHSPFDTERSAKYKLNAPTTPKPQKSPAIKKEPKSTQPSVENEPSPSAPNNDSSKRSRKPKVFADFVSVSGAPSPSTPENRNKLHSKAEENGSESIRLRSADQIKEENVVVSRSGRRIKARSLEIVDQMPNTGAKREGSDPTENGNLSQTPDVDLTESDVAIKREIVNDAAGSPERPRRSAIKRKHYEELVDIDDIIDNELPPVSPKKTSKPVAKITPVEAEGPKGKENTPTTPIPEKTEPLQSPGKGPKINFTFSKFTERLLSNTTNETVITPGDVPTKKKPKKTDSSRGVNDRLCSLSCPGRKCSLPTLHCDVCLCLFHPECVGFTKGSPKAFTCNWCKKDQGPKNKDDAEKQDEVQTNNETGVVETLKPVPITIDETEENAIASDDDVEFLPQPPEVIFSSQVNHNVPVVPGIAFMRPPPPLTRAPILPVNSVPQAPSLPRVAPASTVPTQLVPPFGMASTTLRSMANLAQSLPKPPFTAVTTPPPPILLAKTPPSNIMANGPRPCVPSALPTNPLQVSVPGMTKGTLIYTNNPNLRFILTPSIPASTTAITTPVTPVPSKPVIGDLPNISVGVEPAASTSKTSPLQVPVQSSEAALLSMTNLKSTMPEKKPQMASPPPPPLPSPPPVHVPDPEPIVIDISQTSLCDMMLKIKMPDPSSGLKKAQVILKKPETREKGPPIPKPKKRGRAKGTIMKKPDQNSEMQPKALDEGQNITSEPQVPEATTSKEATEDTQAVTKPNVVQDQKDSKEPEALKVDENQIPDAKPDEPMDISSSKESDLNVSAESAAVGVPPEKVTESNETPQDENQSPENAEKEKPTENPKVEEEINEDRPFSPLPDDDSYGSDSDSVKSDYERPPSPRFLVILKEVTYDKSARIVTTCLSNRGAQLTSPSANCARTLRYKRALIDTGWSEEHTYSFSPKQACLSSTRKTVMTLNIPKRSFQSLQSASDTLHLIFEYLNAQDLIRAGQVCRSWRKLATQPHLWKAVKLKGLSVTDWSACARMLDTVKTTYLDLRGMKCKEDMWNQFVGTLHHLRNIEELVFGEVPAFVLTVVASSLSKLQCLEAEYIYTDVKRLPFWDPGCIASLQKLSILRLRASKGLELPRFLSYGGYSAFSHLSYLTHLSVTSYRNSKSTDFEFLEKMSQLEVLEIGSCQDWDEKSYKRLVKLKSLCRLRLELGGTAADRGLANALTYLSRLEDLTLIYFKITSSLAAAIRRLRSNLCHLTLWPDMSSEGGLIVYNTLQAVRSLKKLQSFSWGIIYEDTSNTKYSRHASKYRESSEVDEWWSEELRKTPHARGIRVPLLKALSESGKQQESKNEMQQGLIGVGHLHHKLKRLLPDSDVYIYQVPESLLTKVYGTLR